MSKNFPNQNPSNHNLKTDEGLTERYKELLQAEHKKRPAWEDQTFSQKMDARFEGAASTYMACASAFLAVTPPFRRHSFYICNVSK